MDSDYRAPHCPRAKRRTSSLTKIYLLPGGVGFNTDDASTAAIPCKAMSLQPFESSEWIADMLCETVIMLG